MYMRDIFWSSEWPDIFFLIYHNIMAWFPLWSLLQLAVWPIRRRCICCCHVQCLCPLSQVYCLGRSIALMISICLFCYWERYVKSLIIVNLLIALCSSVRVSFIYFEALFYPYKFRIAISSWWIDSSIIMNYFSFLSSNAFSIKICFVWYWYDHIFACLFACNLLHLCI